MNATLFGSTNVAYQIAKNGELPPAFSRKLWGRDVEGLFITAGLVLVFELLFPLSSVASMGSAGFLLVYAAVSIGHMRIRNQTGAKAWPVVASVAVCLSLLIILVDNMVSSAPSSVVAFAVTLALSFLFEVLYRRVTGGTFGKILSQSENSRTCRPTPDGGVRSESLIERLVYSSRSLSCTSRNMALSPSAIDRSRSIDVCW